MAEERIEFKIIVDDTGALVGLKSTQKGVKDIDLTARGAQESAKNLTSELERIGSGRTVTSIKLTDSELKKLNKTLQQQKSATGASTSAVLELGRVIQDAPYGIRGMANNITQLVTMVSFATVSAGGFTAALKQMWTAMLGPLGIVFGISAVVSALDYFYGGQKKAEEATKDTTDEISKQAREIEKLDKITRKYYDYLGEKITTITSDGKVFQEEFFSIDEAVKVLSRDFAEFSRGVDALSEKDKKDPNKLNNLIQSFRLLLSQRERLKDLSIDLDKFTKLQDENIENLYEQGKATVNVSSKVKDLSLEYVRLQKSILISESAFNKESERRKKERVGGKQPEAIPTFKTKEQLDIDIKNQENALLEFEKKIKLQSLRNSELEELASAKTEKEKTEIQRRYAELRLEIELSNEEKKLILAKSNERTVAKIKHDEHVAELKRIFEEYKLKVELNEKLTTEQKESAVSSAKSKRDESISQAGGELIQTNKQIDDAYAPLFDTFNKLADLRRAALGIVPEDEKAKEFDALSSYIDSYKTLMSGLTDFIDGEFERQLTIEQNKTNELNAELNNRLLNENLSKDERAKIQNEIARNDEALRIKQNEIAKKQFNTQKAFNIAMAVADTYLAGVKVLADPSFIGRPWARGIAMAATIASGLASVAAIARQKFQPSAANTPVRTSGSGGSGGGMGDRSFNFNLVGNNRENQLVNAIQGQFNQPLKAYVVSRDMSNQQQLDANIVNSARF
jgi:hypothetical protein